MTQNGVFKCSLLSFPRLGYTNEGRVYSIIYPQQGAFAATLGCMNVEVTVTGQRGWVNEKTRGLAADMTVEGKIWFSPSAKQKPLVKLLWLAFKKSDLPFPSDKASAIRVSTHKHNNKDQPIFPVRNGETTLFASPEFAKHPEAWTVGNGEVEIGPIIPTNDPTVDEFNKFVLEVFNLGSGNMLQSGNLLSWNVWFTQPELVNQKERKAHAEKWRKSIDANHGSPTGPGTEAKYFDGSPFKPVEELIEEEIKKILSYLEKNL